MISESRNEVVTAKVTPTQKNAFIEKAKQQGLSLSEWIANSLEDKILVDEFNSIYLDQLEAKDKVINKITLQLENKDLHLNFARRRNINYKARIARLTKENQSLKVNNSSQTTRSEKNIISNNSKQSPIYAVGSIVVLLTAIIFANK